MGIDTPLIPGDVAARGNFCLVDGNGLLVDRRAGRIPTEFSTPLCQRLDRIEIPGVELDVYPVQDYRFVLRLRGEGLSERITETDPQISGVAPLSVEALEPQAERTASIVNDFLTRAKLLLAEEERANMVMLRGFAQLPNLPPMGDVYRLNPAGIAAYPMYRGLAAAVGMDIAESGPDIAEELDVVRRRYRDYDFIYLHFKPTDSAGEDGDFAKKVRLLEQADGVVLSLIHI